MCKRNQINPFQVKAEYLLLHGGLAKKGQEYLKMPISLKTVASIFFFLSQGVGVGVGKAVASDKGKPLIFSINTYIHTKTHQNKRKK
jgi:hypothetical protein